MRTYNSAWIACVLACGATVASAQTSVGRSFETVSKSCDGIQWSQQSLQLYPRIAAACQGVEQRNGKTYVKFEGTVKRVLDRGEKIVMDMKDAGQMTLSPPPETKLYIAGQQKAVSKLTSGTKLTFYVAEDRLAAQIPETELATTRYVIIPISPTEPEPERTASLPATAGFLPFVAFAGLLALGAGSALTLSRRRLR